MALPGAKTRANVLYILVSLKQYSNHFKGTGKSCSLSFPHSSVMKPFNHVYTGPPGPNTV